MLETGSGASRTLMKGQTMKIKFVIQNRLNGYESWGDIKTYRRPHWVSRYLFTRPRDTEYDTRTVDYMGLDVGYRVKVTMPNGESYIHTEREWMEDGWEAQYRLEMSRR